MPYPKEITTKAFSILTERRNNARSTVLMHKSEISVKLPAVIEIEDELLNTSVRLSKAILSGTDIEQKIEELKNSNLALQNKRHRLLTSSGYSSDYLEKKPFCEVCDDTGYANGTMCACFKAVLKDLTYEKLNHISDIKNCGFDNFSLEYYTEPRVRSIMSRNLDTCLNYARGFSLKSDSLFMLGGTGLGKTHLSLSIAGFAIEKGFDVLYTPVQTLLNKLEKDKFSKETDSSTFSDYMEFILNCDLLILDDLGAEFPTQFTTSTIYNIINSRLIERQPTIISSNLDLKSIEGRYSERIVSRLIGGYTILPFEGNDVRILKKQNQK